MSHFAQINNGIVIRVIVAEQEVIDSGIFGDVSSWVQTSYNTRGGVHYDPISRKPSEDQTKAFRKNYAGVGFSWDGTGFAPPQPYPSWIKDSFTYLWNAPVPRPTDGKIYRWNEDTMSWIYPTN